MGEKTDEIKKIKKSQILLISRVVVTFFTEQYLCTQYTTYHNITTYQLQSSVVVYLFVFDKI